jgi:hypothetical protein
MRGRVQIFRPDVQKPRQMENAARKKKYNSIYGEVNVSVSNGYVLQYAGGTRASCFISVTLKTWSGRKFLDPTT